MQNRTQNSNEPEHNQKFTLGFNGTRNKKWTRRKWMSNTRRTSFDHFVETANQNRTQSFNKLGQTYRQQNNQGSNRTSHLATINLQIQQTDKDKDESKRQTSNKRKTKVTALESCIYTRMTCHKIEPLSCVSCIKVKHCILGRNYISLDSLAFSQIAIHTSTYDQLETTLKPRQLNFSLWIVESQAH